VPTFADTGCQVVHVTDPYGRILYFLDLGRYFLSSSSSVVLTRLSGVQTLPQKKSGLCQKFQQFWFYGSYILNSTVEVAALKFALMQGPFNLLPVTVS
jgi:hypothetical protein